MPSPQPPASSPYKCFVFDLDGTLVDSRRDLADSANELLRQCGRPPLTEGHIGGMVGEGAAVLVSRVFAASGIAQPPDALARFLAIYDTRLLNHTRVYDGMIEVLRTLRRRVSLAVLTNKPLASTRRVLAGLQLEEFFPAVLGGDGPFPRKPDAGGLRHLAESASVPIASTLLVGDSSIDLQTATNAGAAICLARYGFGFDTIRTADLTDKVSIIDTPTELLEL